MYYRLPSSTSQSFPLFRIFFRAFPALVGLWLVATPVARAAEVTDESVDDAIRRAAEWIKTQRNAEGHWDTLSSSQFFGGDSGLALLSLLYAGENPLSPEIDQSLQWLTAIETDATYVIGTRAHVLALVPGTKYRSVLDKDLSWLEQNIHGSDSESPGAYHYKSNDKGYDNSNSQYGVLGTWMATDAGMKVESRYWELVAEHWLGDQNADGGWGYTSKESSRGSMSAAGLATLYVVLDRYFVTRPRDALKVQAAIEKGLDWLGVNFSTEHPGGEQKWNYYYLYSVERIGRASGQKYFRSVDWFRAIAGYLLELQEPSGAWEGAGNGEFDMSKLRNTSFALMFLCHGRAPLVFNKLEYTPPDLRGKPRPTGPPPEVDEEGKSKSEIRKLKREREQLIKQMEEEQQRRDDWNNNARDVAGLTHYSHAALERLLNWQIVRLDGSIEDLMEAPVLFLSGRLEWNFSDDEVSKLREYCNRGGLLMGVANDDGAAFENGFRSLAKRMYPDYELKAIPKNHPILTNETRTPIKDPPPLFEVSNGLRSLILFCPEDISRSWHRAKSVGKAEEHFDLGLNIYLYATDRTTPRSRLKTPNIAVKQVEIERELTVARIKYDGVWDPEPYGWERFSHYLNNEAATRLKVVKGVTLDSPKLREYQIAYITGPAAFTLSDAEQQGLRRFINSGGTLIADAAGGSREFAESFEKYVKDALKTDPLRVPDDAAIITGRRLPGSVSLTEVGYKRAARRESRGKSTPLLSAYNVGGRYAVVYSTLDISTGMLGTNVFDCRGYDGDSCLDIMRNLLMYGDLSTIQKAKLTK